MYLWLLLWHPKWINALYSPYSTVHLQCTVKLQIFSCTTIYPVKEFSCFFVMVVMLFVYLSSAQNYRERKRERDSPFSMSGISLVCYLIEMTSSTWLCVYLTRAEHQRFGVCPWSCKVKWDMTHLLWTPSISVTTALCPSTGLGLPHRGGSVQNWTGSCRREPIRQTLSVH